MRFSPISFLLGLGAAAVLPIISKAFRPFAVEAAALGLTVVEEGRRIIAEQMENLEDLAAEARLRREHLAAAMAANGAEDVDVGEGVTAEAPAASRTRRRTSKVRAQTP